MSGTIPPGPRLGGMHFHVSARLAYRFAQPSEVLLLLEAARGPDQAVRSDRLIITPADEAARLDDGFTGERRCVFTGHGDVEITYEADVEILPRDATLQGIAATPIRDLPAEALKYLRPSRYCPSDRLEGFAERAFGKLKGGEKVQAILDWISSHMEYQGGISTSASTALDTFIDRAGVCRDFAHLAITLCRAADIPARAVSAYAWKLDPPDMHAVVEVFLGGRWRMIDPTCKAPIEGLVRVATGLDATDIAFMTIFGSAELLSQSFEIVEIAPAAAA